MTPQTENTLCICRDAGCTVPYGKCHCLCGGTTSVSPVTRNNLGHIKGRPVKFISGHSGAKHQREIIDGPVIDGDECILIKLTQGEWAIALKSEREKYSKDLWFAHKSRDNFYAAKKVEIEGKSVRVFMHREILGLSIDDPIQGDHRNGCTLDNRPRNLRLASYLQNSKNRRKYKTNTSGYKGVSFHIRMGKYVACIFLNGKNKQLGVFDDPESAHKVYCAAAKRYYGDFARFE